MEPKSVKIWDQNNSVKKIFMKKWSRHLILSLGISTHSKYIFLKCKMNKTLFRRFQLFEKQDKRVRKTWLKKRKAKI